MLSFLGSVLSFLGPVILWGIKTFVKNQEARERRVKNYYEFLAQIDKGSAAKVANYIAAERDLKRVQREIREKELIEPSRETATEVKKPYEVPQIVEVEVEAKTHGKYLTESGKAQGLVVHFTAGRYEKGAKSAKNTLQYLAKKGLCCLVMDVNGVVYKAKSQDLDEIGWHAGESEFKDKKGMSRYLLGMEICNAGKLIEKEGKFFPWWSFSEEKLLPDQEPIHSVNRIDFQSSNQKPGVYHKFTWAQEQSLINFILWQLDVNPEFKISHVVGHDEIAPGRKNDPGGSLSMTMPEFRNMIYEKSKELDL